MTTIRPATVADRDAFRRVYEAVAAEGRWIGGEVPVDWDSRRPTWEELVADDAWGVLVADVDGAVVGWLSAHHLPNGRVELGMAILDGHRSRGIGSALMEALLAWARDRGAHKVTLELWPHNDRARGLYEKFGFVVEGRLRRQWRRNDGSLWDSLAMGLVLDEASPGSPW